MAWAEYLAAIDGISPIRYDEVEEWAWMRLVEKLTRHGVKVERRAV